MNKAKRILAILIALGIGAYLVYAGVNEFRASRQLATEGKAVMAQVLDREMVIHLKRRNAYYVSVQYETDAGTTLRQRVPVSAAQYRKAPHGSAIKLFYLSRNPLVCQVGEEVETKYGNAILGVVFVLGGLLLSVVRRPLSEQAAAAKVAEHVGALCQTHYQYAPVDAKQFRHLDLRWYDEGRQRLEDRGFVFLQDEENLTFRRTSKGNRTLLRTLLNRDGTTMAYLYHFKPGIAVRWLGARQSKVLDLESRFSNGTFVCTSNAEAAGKLDSPPGVKGFHLAAVTPLETILASHEQRVNQFLAAHSGVASVRMNGIEDVHRAQNVLQQIKAEYRKKTGITKVELQRLGGANSRQQIDRIHAEALKLHQERIRKAA
jgi:Protein of unknown function (DUF3592)